MTTHEIKVVDAKGGRWSLVPWKYIKGELFWMALGRPLDMLPWEFIHTPVFTEWWYD